MSIGKTWRYGDKRSNFNYQRRFLQEIADCCETVIRPAPPPHPYAYFNNTFAPAAYGSVNGGYLTLSQIDINGTSYFPGELIMNPGCINPIVDYPNLNAVIAAESPTVLVPSIHFSGYGYENNMAAGIIAESGSVIQIYWDWTDGFGTFANGNFTLNELFPYIPVRLDCFVSPSPVIDVGSIAIPAPPAPFPTGATLAEAAFSNVFPGSFLNIMNTGGYYISGACDRMDSGTYYASIEKYLQDQYGSQITLSYTILNAKEVSFMVNDVPQGLAVTTGTTIVFDYGCSGASLGSLPLDIVEV